MKGHIADELFTNNIKNVSNNDHKIPNLHVMLNNSEIFNKKYKYNSRFISSKPDLIHCAGYENINTCVIYLRSYNTDTMQDLYNYFKQEQQWEILDMKDKNKADVVKITILKSEMQLLFKDFKIVNVVKEKCIAKTKKGDQCKNNAKYNNFCHIHRDYSSTI